MRIKVTLDELLNEPVLGGMAPPPVPKPPIPFALRSDEQQTQDVNRAIKEGPRQVGRIPDLGLGPNVEGTAKIVQGVKTASKPGGRAKARGAHEVVEGLMDVGSQFVPGGLMEEPVRTAVGLAVGSGTKYVADEGLKAAGVNPDYAAIISDVASLVAGGFAASRGRGKTEVPPVGESGNPPGGGSAPLIESVSSKFEPLPEAPRPTAWEHEIGESTPPTAPPPAVAAQAGTVEPPVAASSGERGAIAINAKAVQDAALAAQTHFVDRLAPLHAMVKDKGLTLDEDPYTAARLYAGHYGKIENRLDSLASILPKGTFVESLFRRRPQLLQDATDYMTLERHIELGTRPDLVGSYQIPGNRTVPQVQAELAAMEQGFGTAKLGEVKQLAQNIRQYSNDILQEAADAGVISQAAHAAIRAGNEKYIPFDRMEYVADEFDKLPRGSNSFNVPKQNIVRKIAGSQKEIADPISSLIRQTAKFTSLIERNRVSQKVAALATDPQFAGIVEKVGSGGTPPRDMEKMAVLENGVKEEYAVPKNVGEALKGMNAESADLMTKWASMSAAMLRAGATSLNVGFIPANAIRDYQTARIVSKVGFNPIDWGRGFAEAIKKGPEYERYLESGGSFSGFFGSQKNLATQARQLTQPKSFVAAKTILNPIELLRFAGEHIELAPRLGVFKRSLRQGLSDTEAAINSRNATVDFAKSGVTIKTINRWIPFLNARLQGTLNMLGAVKNRPGKALLGLNAVVGIPVVSTYLFNTRFHKDVWDDIDSSEKDNNFLIIYGNAKNENGDYTQVWKLPKGDAKVFGNPLENFLGYLEHNNPKALDAVAMQMGSDLSPVPFERDGRFSGLQVAGGITPPALKAWLEGENNKNWFTEREIVPTKGQYGDMTKASPANQFFPNTPKIFVKAGELTGISPLKIQNAVGTQFGGAGRQLSAIASGKPGDAWTQIIRRFTVARGKQKETAKFDALRKIETAAADEKLNHVRTAKQVIEELTSLPPEKRQARAKEMLQSGKLDEAAIKAVDTTLNRKLEGLSAFESHIRAQPVGTRAAYLVDRILATPDVKERARLLEDWTNKKIITEKVMDGINEEVEKRAAKGAKPAPVNPVFDPNAFWQDLNRTVTPPVAGR